jgi:hypothetical protein
MYRRLGAILLSAGVAFFALPSLAIQFNFWRLLPPSIVFGHGLQSVAIVFAVAGGLLQLLGRRQTNAAGTMSPSRSDSARTAQLSRTDSVNTGPASTVYCASCGLGLQVGQAFCGGCGAIIAASEVAGTAAAVPIGVPATPVCPACGRTECVGEAFCGYTGRALRQVDRKRPAS